MWQKKEPPGSMPSSDNRLSGVAIAVCRSCCLHQYAPANSCRLNVCVNADTNCQLLLLKRNFGSTAGCSDHQRSEQSASCFSPTSTTHFSLQYSAVYDQLTSHGFKQPHVEQVLRALPLVCVKSWQDASYVHKECTCMANTQT